MPIIQYCGSPHLCTLKKCKTRARGCILNDPPVIQNLFSERTEKIRLSKLRPKTKCHYCGDVFHFITRDHVVPRSKGGSNRKDNIVPACQRCNSKKSNMDYYHFLKRAKHLGINLCIDRVQELSKYIKTRR